MTEQGGLTIFDECSIKEYVLLNDGSCKTLGLRHGHNALLFMDSSGRGIYFNFGPGKSGILKYIYAKGEMLRIELGVSEIQRLLSDGTLLAEGGCRYQFARRLARQVSDESGRAMYGKAMEVYRRQPFYSPFAGWFGADAAQCDQRTSQILAAGGNGYPVKATPNASFEALAKKYREGNARMDDNERMDLTEMEEEMKPEAQDEILEELSENAVQPDAAPQALGGLMDEVKQEGETPEEASEEALEEFSEVAPQATKIGAGAWLALIAVCLLAAAALVPAWQYTRLAVPAARGVFMESAGRCNSAASAYNELRYLEQEVAEWGAENFAFGELPAFATGDFAIERFVPLIYKLDGLLSAYEAASQHLQEGPVRPLRVRRLLARIAPLDEMNQLIGENLDPAANEMNPATGQPAHDQQARARFLLEATQAARAKDEAAKDRALLYDAIELNFAVSLDAGSKETERRIAALKKAAGSEPWMYEGAQLMRARATDDFSVLAEVFASKFARNREDYESLTGQAKALHLGGETAKAGRIIKKYSRGQTEGFMQALRAELLIREGKYQEAIDICDKVIATGKVMNEMTAPSARGSGIMGAVAQKGAALLCLDRAQEAHDLFSGAMEAPFGEPGQAFMGATLAAAILAGDDEAAQMQAMIMQQYGYTVSKDIFEIETERIEQELEALKEEYLEDGMELEEFLEQHEITLEEFLELTAQTKTTVSLASTLEEIYTEGWGGF